MTHFTLKFALTGYEKTPEGHEMELFVNDVKTVHKQIKQRNGQLSCRVTQVVLLPDDCQPVDQIAPLRELGRLRQVHWQLCLLLPQNLMNVISKRMLPPVFLGLHGNSSTQLPKCGYRPTYYE